MCKAVHAGVVVIIYASVTLDDLNVTVSDALLAGSAGSPEEGMSWRFMVTHVPGLRAGR